MLVLFPPGVTAWDSTKTKSEWREFAFALHLLQQAIDPTLSLEKVMACWNEISSSLAEGSRTRKPQISEYTFS